MAFPTSPTNGQTATVNGVVYTYNSTLTAWTVGTEPGGNVSGNVLNITSSASIGTTLSAAGNITGNYILGNGALLTGVITSVANINLGTSNVTVVSSNGNITMGVGGTSNVVVVATTGAYATGLLSATGNITGGNITTGGTLSAVSIVESSSITLKENIRPIEHPLESILQLLGVMYDRKDGSTKNEIGLLAEDVYKIIPNIVSLDDKGNPAGVMYTKLSIYLLETIKKLHSEVEQLKRDR